MTTLFGRPLFSVGDRPYFWEDVVLAAMLGDAWTSLEQQLRQGLACVKRAHDRGEQVSAAESTAAAHDFRFRRNLISGDDTSAWLERSDLTTERWTRYLERAVLRQRWSAELDDIVLRYPVPSGEIQDDMLAEAVCSGVLADSARQLSGRAAIDDRVRTSSSAPAVSGASAPPDSPRRVPAIADAGLPGLSIERVRDRIPIVTRVEATYQSFVSTMLTSALVDRTIEHRQLDWMAIDCRHLIFANEDAAREAALAASADKRALVDVASDAGIPLQTEHLYLGDLDAELKGRLLGAGPGDIVGPVRSKGAFHVLEVVGKVVPSADDPAIRARAEEEALRFLVTEESTTRVRWHEQV